MLKRRTDELNSYREQTSLGVTNRRYMLYDGETPCFEVDSSGVLKATNVYAPDGLVSRNWSSSNQYFLFDWQGNLLQSMNSSTGLQASYAFNAWGQRNASAGTGRVRNKPEGSCALPCLTPETFEYVAPFFGKSTSQPFDWGVAGKQFVEEHAEMMTCSPFEEHS